jgi:hypothetical protein
MKIREITVGDLPGFVRSEEYAGLHPKPITPLRALSQFNNPHARKEDIALVFAVENNTLIAFAGLLPHALANATERVFSNSGWWVHPDLGRQMGLPLFLKALQLCNQRMFFTDSPAHTQAILERTGLFTYLSPKNGTRFFLRFYLGKWLKRKKFVLFPLFSLADGILNALCSLRFPFLLKNNILKQYSIQSTNELSSEYDAFIKKHSCQARLKQERARLNWIVRYPWITSQDDIPDISYPFSYRTDNFCQNFLIIRKEKDIKAILLLSVRNDHASIPFIYYKKESLPDIALMIREQLIKAGIDSLVVFRQELQSALKKAGHFWLFRKNILRFSGYSKQLHSVFGEDGYFQDGDGDAAFT